MPRKTHGAKLEKVVSTTITLEDFNLLEKFTRIRYNENKLKQPTISHLLRAIITAWANVRRNEGLTKMSPSQTPNYGPAVIR